MSIRDIAIRIMFFLGYNDEHKGYLYWDHVGCLMPISQDITSNESRPYQPRPSSSTFSMESFHNFPTLLSPLLGPNPFGVLLLLLRLLQIQCHHRL